MSIEPPLNFNSGRGNPGDDAACVSNHSEIWRDRRFVQTSVPRFVCVSRSERFGRPGNLRRAGVFAALVKNLFDFGMRAGDDVH